MLAREKVQGNIAKIISLLILAFLTCFCLLGLRALPNLKTQYTLNQFLPEQHPLLQVNKNISKIFGIEETRPFFILMTLPENEGEWLVPERIKRLDAFATKLRTVVHVKSVVNLGNVEGASTGPEGITIGKLLELTPERDWRSRIYQDPLLSPNILSHDGRSTVVSVVTDPENTGFLHGLLQSTRLLAAQSFPEASVKLGGSSPINSEMNEMLGQELRKFLIFSLIASLVTLVAFFRNASSIVIPLLIMVLANIASLAWMAWTGVIFTILSTTLPILVSITVISMSAHTMLRYASDWNIAKYKEGDRVATALRSFRILFVPNFLTAISTAVGFLAISFTKIPLIHQYGLTVCISIFIAWVAIILALPPLLILFPAPVARSWTARQARWSLLIIKRKKTIAFAVILLALGFLWEGRKLNWSPLLFDDLPAKSAPRLATESIDRNFGGIMPLEVAITIPKEESPWNDPSRIRKLDELEQLWRASSGVGSVTGLADLLRATAKINGDDLPASRKAAAEYGFLYGFGETNLVSNFLSTDGRDTRISLRLHDIPAGKIEALKAMVSAGVRAAFPEAEVQLAGMATVIPTLNHELSRDLIFGLWQALALISLLLLLVFRSWIWVLVAVLPNLIAPMLLLGALAIFHTPIKPGIAMIFSIALGISFDNTVYVLGRLRFLIKEGSSGFPVGKAWYQEANLCLFSSLALSAGFIVFLGSYFTLNKQFGAYMLLSIAGGVLGDLILLPAVLSISAPYFRKSTLALKNRSQKETSMSRIIATAVFAFLLFVPLRAQAINANDAGEILKAVEKNVTSRDEIAKIKMVIVEAEGGTKDRNVEIRRMGAEDKQKVLVRLLGPADLKGTALLSVAKGEGNDQWLYLPSSKQTRRILSSKKSSNFMDSELSYEDMGSSSQEKNESKVLRQEKISGKIVSVIESINEKSDSAYGKILIWVSHDPFLVDKMEYYDKSGALLKTSEFSDYKQFESKIWRAQKVRVTNAQNKRGTILELSGLKLNSGLKDSEFTEGALADSD